MEDVELEFSQVAGVHAMIEKYPLERVAEVTSRRYGHGEGCTCRLGWS
jgi:hypothetical protein